MSECEEITVTLECVEVDEVVEKIYTVKVPTDVVTVIELACQQGPPGPQGPAGAIEWDETTEYTAGDVIFYDGSFYEALLDNVGVEPGTDPLTWDAVGGAVDSVNGQTGTVVLDAGDVGADPAGSAATAESNANAYTDSEIAAIDFPVDSVNDGTGVDVDNTDPDNPIVNLNPATLASLLLADGAFPLSALMNDEDLATIVSGNPAGISRAGLAADPAFTSAFDASGAAATAQTNANSYTDAELLGYVQSVSAGSNVTVDNTDPQNPIVSASSSLNIGDLIGNSPVVIGSLYADAAGALQNDVFTFTQAPFLGTIPRSSLTAPGYADTSFTFFDASGAGFVKGARIGVPDQGALLVGLASSVLKNYLWIIADSPNPAEFVFDAQGTGGSPVLAADVASVNIYQPLNMHSVQIDHLADGTVNHHGVNLGQLNGMIPKSLIDAKGDLIVGTADNTVARLPVGTDTYVLAADSGQPSGLNWIPMGGGLSLETNGTPNGDQTLLNLIAGTGVTLTDDGIGGVTVDSAGGGGSPGGSDTNVQVNDSGAFYGDDNFRYDKSQAKFTVRRFDASYNGNILEITKDTDNQVLVAFYTPNPSYLTNFSVYGPGAANGITFTCSAAVTSSTNIGAGADLFYFYSTGYSITTFASEDNGRVQIGAWQFASRQTWVEVYGGDSSIPTFGVRNAAGQTAISMGIYDSSASLLWSVDKDGKQDAVAYSVGGVAGFTGTVTAASLATTTITITDGIITDVS